MYSCLMLMLPTCAAISHHLSPESSLGLGEVDPERGSVGVSRRTGDEISRWKGVQSIKTFV